MPRFEDLAQRWERCRVFVAGVESGECVVPVGGGNGILRRDGGLEVESLLPGMAGVGGGLCVASLVLVVWSSTLLLWICWFVWCLRCEILLRALLCWRQSPLWESEL